MTFDNTCWHRMVFDHTPVYILKNGAQWFVPNAAGDNFLKSVAPSPSSGDIDTLRFLARLPDGSTGAYPGRGKHLEIDKLNELWFHVTNRCNLSCTHCLFSSSSNEPSEMPGARIIEIADEAARLGCRVFALTGGEPFVHPDFEMVVDHLLSFEGSHVVVLTNGMGIDRRLDSAPWNPDRFHLQISLDGLGKRHNAIRGTKAFEHLSKSLGNLKKKQIPFALSMCVTRENIADMAGMVDFAADMDAKNVHYMWYFVRGRGAADQLVPTDDIFDHLIAAARRSWQRNVSIDNIEALKTQVFAPPGTIHDGTTTAWESLAVGPDGHLYPSAALVGIEPLAVRLDRGLEAAWKKSAVLKDIRQQTAAGLSHPMKFLLGGGDTDHSYIHAGTFMGDDPYIPLYEKIALWLITRHANEQRETSRPELKLKMGDILESCGAHGAVALVHSNCLLSVARKNSLDIVKTFYGDAARDTREDILNPVCYDNALTDHIPEQYRFRGYGCGSPVADAKLRAGEWVLDLGCGGGVECFIAAKQVGKNGQVVGVDMLDAMLATAKEAREEVARNLGFSNVSFRKGYLEELPIENGVMDAVLSNCVMNLSVNKRRAYAEIFRVLKPGGRLVVSDVVCDEEPDPAIRNDEVFRGECIAGAMTQKDLMGILSETGFCAISLIKRFPYRTVGGHPFYSLTYAAKKPRLSEAVTVIYRGPLKAAITFDSDILLPGHLRTLPLEQAENLGEDVFILDESGAVTNLEMENTCACAVFPEPGGDCCDNGRESGLEITEGAIQFPVAGALMKHGAGCMKCGAPLTYAAAPAKAVCIYCNIESMTTVMCENGHFVCDACHSEEGLPVIEHFCLTTGQTDMIALLDEIGTHPSIPMHGPEHHILVPGIILATYRNIGGNISAETISAGIHRGAQIPGGYCGFMGICGAAIGVGIAFSLLLEANPVTPVERKIVQKITGTVLMDIAEYEAARCCQRDSWLALKKAAALSETVLPLALRAEEKLVCAQMGANKECIRQACPLWPKNAEKEDSYAD